MLESGALRLSLLLFVVSSSLLAQQTLVVGAGQAFASIPAAVAAASPGDTVLVTAGSYSDDVVIRKGIRLVGQPGARLRKPVLPQTGFVVEAIPAQETFVMSGFAADDQAPQPTDIDIRVRDCGGPVILRGLRQSGLERFIIFGSNCSQLTVGDGVLRAVLLTATEAVIERAVLDADFVGVRIDGGRAVVVNCSITGGNFLAGWPGMDLIAGDLVISRSSVFANPAAGNQPAITTSGGAILMDPSTTLVSPSGLAIDGPATVVQDELYSLASDHNDVNGELELENHGVAGNLFVTVSSLPSPSVPTSLGVAWVDPASILVVHGGVYPPSRLALSTHPLPPLPPGLAVTLQSVTFAASGFGLSTPSVLVFE